jgi:hypothetical protein
MITLTKAFFMEETRHGRSHKLLPDVLDRIQVQLDDGKSAYSIAKEEGISEGSIRYAFKHNRLKKSQSQQQIPGRHAVSGARKLQKPPKVSG